MTNRKIDIRHFSFPEIGTADYADIADEDFCIPPSAIEIVGLKGFEPLTLRLSSACSNQLSYRPKKFSE
jgi:hypothetical protein